MFGALFPAMFDGVHKTERYRWVFRALLGYAVVGSAAMVVLAPWLARLLFDDPPGGSMAIRVLSFGLVATIFRLRFSFELIASGRERSVLVVAAVSVAAALAGYVLRARSDSILTVTWVQTFAAFLNTALLALVLRRDRSATGRFWNRSDRR
ncbi:MAG: FtsH-binding integral membrane protein [Acidimicrobiales bacterium]|jgi:FtsH-binding integral membrane protein